MELLSFKSCFSKEQGLDSQKLNSFLNMSLEMGDLASHHDLSSEADTNALTLS
jgi:hypothetical protein